MKQPKDWTEQDILSLIENRIEEGSELEFKSANALGRTDAQKRELSKDVSAFANSAGGTIIYGLDESDAQPHYAASLTPIDPKQISKEWLEQVINSTIQPRIGSVFINPIELKDKSPGNYCYIACVPESYTAHQASDKRYYKRYNFESVPMEDYEVRQTMNRAARPSYRLALTLVQKQGTDTRFHGRFHANLENISEIVGHDVSAVLFAPRHLIEDAGDTVASFDGAEYARIAGTPFSPSREYRWAINPANPLASYAITFDRTVHIPLEPLWVKPLAVFVKVFDQFGLSLTTKFNVMGDLGVRLIEEWPAVKRFANPESIGSLP